MVIVLWILVLYVGNVFLARWFNYLGNKIEGDNYKAYGWWFIPIFGPVTIGVVLCIIYYESLDVKYETDYKWLQWFRGEHWDKDKNR